MRPYADPTFLLPLYVDSKPSEQAKKTLGDIGAQSLPMSPLLWMEVLNAIQLHPYEARTHGLGVSAEVTTQASSNFAGNVMMGQMFQSVDLDWMDLSSRVEDLSLRYTAKHGFAINELLHVASAQLLKSDEFWSFDYKARHLAELEGLTVNSL